MAVPVPVLNEFLYALNRMLESWGEEFHPVLRGSVLMHHWYGDRARPPADIDLECFTRVVERDDEDDFDNDYERPDDGFYGPIEGRFGRYGDFVSRVDLGKAMCRYASQSSSYQRPGGDVGIRFDDAEDAPEDGASLWVYGTPGRRYYTRWEWANHFPNSGLLQLDLSTPGNYQPQDIGVKEITLHAPGNVKFKFAAYSQEAMLATKVSWLMRSFSRTDSGQVTWTGQPKDLFDAHLLSREKKLDAELFQKALLSFGVTDGLEWCNIDTLFAIKWVNYVDSLFNNWPEFESQYPNLVGDGPVTLWIELTQKLEPILGELYPQAELPFLKAISSNPEDQVAKLVYADWLDERSDPRGPILRTINDALTLSRKKFNAHKREELLEEMSGTSQAWLNQLFGTSQKLNDFRKTLAEQ